MLSIKSIGQVLVAESGVLRHVKLTLFRSQQLEDLEDNLSKCLADARRRAFGEQLGELSGARTEGADQPFGSRLVVRVDVDQVVGPPLKVRARFGTGEYIEEEVGGELDDAERRIKFRGRIRFRILMREGQE